jgi:hypothetical protein
MAGRRATVGNYNDPQNFGWFLNDLPAQNRLTLLDSNRRAIANASVRIYQSAVNLPAWYAINFDDVADLTLTTDNAGQVLVGRNPFAHTPIYQYWGGTNSVAIVRVEKDGNVWYGFLESRLFNLAYWRGDTFFADHELIVGPDVMLCGIYVPVLRSPAWDETRPASTVVSWDPLPDATEYAVWASTNLSTPRIVGTTTGTSMNVHLSGRVYWWVEARTAMCGSRRSETSRFIAPAPPRRRAI